MNELERAAKESSDSNTDFDKKTKEQVDPIGQNIETIADLHIRMEKKVDRHQRSIETVTAFLGRPRFLYIILTFVALWILMNVALIVAKTFTRYCTSQDSVVNLRPLKSLSEPGGPTGREAQLR